MKTAYAIASAVLVGATIAMAPTAQTQDRSRDPAAVAAKRAKDTADQLKAQRRAGSGPRILDGKDALPGDLPFQAAIMHREVPDGVMCGAAFVRPNIVMTAAHCVTEMIGNAKTYRIISGKINLTDPGMSSHDITHVVPHPQYQLVPGGLDYDFALIKVVQPFTGTTIPIVSADESNRVTVGMGAQVSGWGATSEGGTGTTKLQKVDLMIVNRSNCNDPNSYNGIITSRMMCAGFKDGKKDSCQGDSGGPMTVTLSPEGKRLVGVVSFGAGCGRPEKYGVYARLNSVRTWINATISQLSAE